MVTKNVRRIELASGLGVKLMYCEGSEEGGGGGGDNHIEIDEEEKYAEKYAIVELEIGSVSIKLSPAMVQRLANMLMKASLKLDQVSQKRAVNASSTAQLMH